MQEHDEFRLEEDEIGADGKPSWSIEEVDQFHGEFDWASDDESLVITGVGIEASTSEEVTDDPRYLSEETLERLRAIQL
jgi:hypothetical protein